MSVKFSQPHRLPVKIDYGVFARELADAQYELGILEGLQRKLQNPSLLIAPLTAKEAAVSSKIEGTQSTASDVFLYEVGGDSRHRDTAEVANYRKAMIHAVGELRQGRAFSSHFIKTIHQILLGGVRHRGVVGEFRKGPVWIAEKYGDPIEKALYVPPEAVLVPDYIENLVDYIEKGDENVLVQAGVIHYQFEAIHPFEDGNGRIGRLLIPFLLHYKKKLSLPIIYLSGYFESHRSQYIDALHAVDKSGSYELWISFFLKAVVEQAKETKDLIDKIYGLYDELRSQFQGTKSPYFIPCLDFIFRRPVFSIPTIIKETKITRITATRLIKILIEEKIILGLSKLRGRTKFYAFDQLLRILR